MWISATLQDRGCTLEVTCDLGKIFVVFVVAQNLPFSFVRV